MADQVFTFVTTTSYGKWLPGDSRGYVQDGRLLPASPTLERHVRRTLTRPPMMFGHDDQRNLLLAFVEACGEFGYRALDLSVESWHLHWIVRHADTVASMVGRLKNRMRQRLNRGRVFTVGYCHRILSTNEELLSAREYISKHRGCQMIDQRPAQPRSPGKAGG